MKRRSLLLISLCSLLIFGACSKKNEVSQELDFLPYINGFTSGQISKYSSIRIVLANEVAEAEEGAPVTVNAFEFSPKIKGETYWVNKRTIEFKPDEPLKNNQSYTAKFLLSNFQKVDEKLETFVFEFQTIKQAINVETDLPVVAENGVMAFTGRLYLTDRDDLDKITKTLTVKLGSQDYLVEWKNFMPKEGGYVYDFYVSGIKQKKEEQLVVVAWDGKAIDADNKGEKIVSIPSYEGLRLVGHNVINGDDSHIQLNFNTLLKKDQDYRSLCYFRDDNITATYVQEGSLLKIYPSKLFFEEKEFVLAPSLKSFMNNALEEEVSFYVKFESLKPAVRFINKGVILPNSSDGLILPFQAVNLNAVDVYILKIYEDNVFQFLQTNNFSGENEIKRVARPLLKKTLNLAENKLLDLSRWQTFSIDLGKLIEKEPGAIYRVFIRFKKDYSVYPCTGDVVEDPITHDINEDELWDESIYSSEYYNFYYYGYTNDTYNQLYNDENDDLWDNRNNPCHYAYYYRSERSAQTNIFASDFGIMAKSGENNNFFVAVTNLLSTAPEKDATVLFYNYQQQVIAESKTDANGFVEIPLDKKPYFLEVRKDNQRGYLKLDDGSSLSFSNFDVGGEQYIKGIKGFIYGERGVWRPGDTLHLSFIIQDEDKALPQGHPITMEIKNPKDQLHARMMQPYNQASDFYVFQIPTTSDVLTGKWNVNIQVGGSVFSKSVPIETVKPNRLKINLDVDMKVIKSGSVPHFTLKSEWLQGATAANKEADVKVKFRVGQTVFEDYKDYIFQSPLAGEFASEEKVLFKGKTDADGNAVFTKEMPKVNNAPGMLHADFTTRVFEGEGDFSINYKTINYSPFHAYVGIRIPKAQNAQGIIYTNRKQTFDLVLVDENGKPTDSNNISFTVYKLNWRWWWDAENNDNLAYYVNNEYASNYFSKKVGTQNGKASVSFEVPDKDWGRYLIVAKDENNGHLTGAVVYFDWANWLGRSGKNNPNGATMLTFSTDKENYKVGEKIKVEFPSSVGRALVTIENRSRVINARWIETKENLSSFEMEVTPEMVPNAYIQVTFIQPHHNTANDLPIRLYGVKNVMVTDKETHLYPVIKMQDKVEPEKKFTVEVSEENEKEMTYTLAIVDEGLLDLTNFKTPDPHPQFYKREALGVRSWDMFDYVIGAYGGKIEQLFAIGGDMQLKSADEDKTNSRFKPVVKFIGPCQLKSGKTNKHDITLPSYFGSVRVMVVAGNDHAYGNTEKAVKVQKPLMVLATLPRVAGTNEEIALPVNVFAMDETSGNVTVTVSGGNILKVVGDDTHKLSFEKPGDKIVTFQLKAGEKVGKEKMKVKATNGKTTAEYEVEMEVRNPNPRIVESKSYILRAGEHQDWAYALTGMPGTNQLSMEVSRIPSLNLESRLEYLIGYPHGCAEQTTSKGFPQLYLPSLMSLSPRQTAAMENNVKSTIQKLTQMQRSDGAILYWMGGNYVYDWVTTYAGHFMLEAKNMGYAVPASFLSQWASYQKQQAQAWSSNRKRDDYDSYDLDDLDQAYRLYTLALYGKPEKGAMNRLRETKDLSTPAAWRLAATYVLAGNPDVAEKIITGLSSEIKEYSAFNNNTFGSSLRDMSMILETQVLLKDEANALKQAQLISAGLNKERWYDTQTTAYALIAMSKFAGLTKADKNIAISYNQDGEAFKKETKDPIFKTALNATRKTAGTVTINNDGAGTVFVTFSQAGIPLENKTPASSNGLTMTVKYVDASGNPVNVSSLKQGTDFTVEVTIRNTSSVENYNEMSLTQVFPSGWEILNDRMINGGTTNSNISYQDIRDDRVLTYFNLKPLEQKTFTVQLNAAYAGKFLLPPTLCEAMYDNKIYARNDGQWVTVSK
jgi:uncharacterized protein YfaS (alpha-2-macroglobulin family)